MFFTVCAWLLHSFICESFLQNKSVLHILHNTISYSLWLITSKFPISWCKVLRFNIGTWQQDDVCWFVSLTLEAFLYLRCFPIASPTPSHSLETRMWGSLKAVNCQFVRSDSCLYFYLVSGSSVEAGCALDHSIMFNKWRKLAWTVGVITWWLAHILV